MVDEEIKERVGTEVLERVPITNHDFRDLDTLVNIGRTPANISVFVNRKVNEGIVLSDVEEYSMSKTFLRQLLRASIL